MSAASQSLRLEFDNRALQKYDIFCSSFSDTTLHPFLVFFGNQTSDMKYEYPYSSLTFFLSNNGQVNESEIAGNKMINECPNCCLNQFS